jgi:hypothetical protein
MVKNEFNDVKMTIKCNLTDLIIKIVNIFLSDIELFLAHI